MANQRPNYRAYTVIKRDGVEDFWLPIGAAFKHEKGDGLNVILQALPIPNADGQCKLVLRPPKADDAAPDASGNVQSLRTENRASSRTRK